MTAKEPNSFDVGIDFEHVLKAISKQIYETPYAFLRENVQNAIDAIRIQSRRDGAVVLEGEYRVEVTVDDRTVTVRDNGNGMTESDLRTYFWTIGASGKRGQDALEAGCVGMFGIGGFANFGVCNALEVISQTEGSEGGTLTRLTEEAISTAGVAVPAVTVQRSDAAGPRGTIVVGHLRDAPDVEQLRTYLRDFVRFVSIPITYNGQSISEQHLADLDDRENLVAITTKQEVWRTQSLAVLGRLFRDQGHTLVASVEGLVVDDVPVEMTGQLRFENGPLDVFKRGFKLCATQVPSVIGISGRLDCDRFTPTAGRDSMDASTTVLLGRIGALLEDMAVDAVFSSRERIAQHTRLFRLVVQRNLISKLGNVAVNLADGGELPLRDIRQRANDGGVAVFYGTSQKQALNQLMQARGHIVVILSGDKHRRRAETGYLERYCSAKPFDGVIDCAEVYESLSRFEKVVLAALELDISKSYEINKSIRLIPGSLTEDVPAYVKENPGSRPLDVFVDVRHAEVTKLERLGYNQLFYSLISTFCHVYLGPALKKWSPRFFGDGAMNLELLAKRRPEFWVLLKDDIGVVRRGGQRQLVSQSDVRVVRVAAESEAPQVAEKPPLLWIIDDTETDLDGYYIRLMDSAFNAYGDLIVECESHGLVWVGNRVTIVATDDVSAQFQYQIVLDEIVAVEVDGKRRAEGVLTLPRPLQGMFGGLYFRIPTELQEYLVPFGNDRIRLELQCEWFDMRSAKGWVADEDAKI